MWPRLFENTYYAFMNNIEILGIQQIKRKNDQIYYFVIIIYK